MSWPMVALGEVVEKVEKWNPVKEAPNDEFRYIDIASVSQETKNIEGVSITLGAEAPSRARQLVAANDVIVSTVRPNLNAVAHVNDKFDGATASTGFCVLRPAARKLDDRFLYQWVRSQAFVANMVSLATGQSYPAVSDKIIKDSKIPLPPLDAQKRIAGILDRADALRRKRRDALALLDTLTQSIFVEMFGDLLSRSEKSETVYLGDLISVRSGYAFKSSDFSSFGSPVVRISNLDGSNVQMSKAARIPEERVEKGKNYEIAEGDLLIAMSGATIGKTGTVPKLFEKSYLNQRVGKYKIDEKSSLTNEFIRHLVITTRYQEIALASAWGAAQPNVSGTQLTDMWIRVPSTKLQSDFRDIQSEISQYRRKCERSLAKCDSLFASLQSRAFSGKL